MAHEMILGLEFGPSLDYLEKRNQLSRPHKVNLCWVLNSVRILGTE